ncbi:alpha/beta fold hydrolase [Pleurocapsa sp. FMAR1]|uniref:alpha/beta fold hydrolase n=1 Tax=Pleurocapsa sp. FMAR1 TaxID=3040204 RepID=UPI0029C9A4EF|nr:alpha/beta hydrolase [Pleurocapsa sp. FMAR1]
MSDRWTRKQIQFNNFAISYQEGGQTAGETILFIHGWGISTEPYQDCLEALAEKYWVIAPDLPGFGRSTCDRSLSSYQTYANCLLQLIDCLNLNKFQLMGHSFGGGVALALAAAIPDRVSSLIAINSTGIPMISLFETIKGRFAELPQQLDLSGWINFSIVMQALGHNAIFHSQHCIEGAQIAFNEDLRPWLNQLRLPCLILWSDRDYFTPIKIGYALAEAIPNAKLQIIPDAYHEWCMMQPKTLADIAFDFFQSIKSQFTVNYESA